MFPPAQNAKLKLIYGLKTSKTCDLGNFFQGKLSTCTCIVYMNGGYSQRGGGGGANAIPPPPPPKRNPGVISRLCGQFHIDH